METSTFDEENNDTLYIAELARNNYENYEENELENDENNDIQEELLQNTRVRGTNRGRGQGQSRGRGRGHGQGYSQSHKETQQLPPPPSFNKFQHLRPLHEFTVNLPDEYQSFSLSPYLIFSLFFSLEQINTIVKNTNNYANLKGAGEGRKWISLTIKEFKIWLAILIYSGIFKLPSIKDYWNRDNKYPEHKITTFMSLLRFEQVYF